MLDPSLFVTRGVLGGSLLGNLGALKRIFGYGDGRLFSASEVDTIAKDHAQFSKSTVDSYLPTLLSTGPNADDKARDDAFTQALADVYGAPLPF